MKPLKQQPNQILELNSKFYEKHKSNTHDIHLCACVHTQNYTKVLSHTLNIYTTYNTISRDMQHKRTLHIYTTPTASSNIQSMTQQYINQEFTHTYTHTNASN